MGCHALLQGISSTQGLNPVFTSPAFAGRFFTTSSSKTVDDFTGAIEKITSAKGLTNGAALKLKHELVDSAKTAGFVYDRASAGFVKDTQPAEAE